LKTCHEPQKDVDKIEGNNENSSTQIQKWVIWVQQTCSCQHTVVNHVSDNKQVKISAHKVVHAMILGSFDSKCNEDDDGRSSKVEWCEWSSNCKMPANFSFSNIFRNHETVSVVLTFSQTSNAAFSADEEVHPSLVVKRSRNLIPTTKRLRHKCCKWRRWSQTSCCVSVFSEFVDLSFFQTANGKDQISGHSIFQCLAW